MRIKELTIKNFMPFLGEYKVILDDGLINIIGKWEGEEKKSNRAGKSSFVDSIFYLLYGKSRAEKEIDLINNLADEELLVRGIFETHEGNEITIERIRTKDNKKKLTIEGVDFNSIEEPQLVINNLIGLTYDEFVTTNYFSQGQINSFMNLTTSQKKDKLVNWVKTFDWEVCENITKGKIIDLNYALTVYETEINTYNKIISDNKEKLEKSISGKVKEMLLKETTIRDEKQIEIDKLKDKINKFDLDSIRKEKENLNKEKSLLLKEQSIKEKKEKQLKEKNIKLNEIDKKLSQLRKLFKEAKLDNKDINEKIETTESRIIGLKSLILNHKSALDKLEKALKNNDFSCQFLADRECEYMNKDIVIYEKARNEKYISEYEKELKQKQNHIRELKEIKDEENELKNKVNNLIKDKKRIEDIEIEIDDSDKNYQKLIDKIDNELEKISIKEENNTEILYDLESELKELKKDMNAIENNIQEYRILIKRDKDLKDTILETESKIEETEKSKTLVKDKIDKLKFISNMFSKSGIPMLEINKNMKELESNINSTLDILNTRMKIEIQTEKTLSTLETECNNCGFIFIGNRQKECPACGERRELKTKPDFDVKIFHNNKELKFELDSGGGQTLISIAIRLSIIKMLKNRGKNKLDFIILDEVFGMLDEVNRDSVSALILDELCDEFKQLFLITHTNIYLESNQDIVIIKEENHSKILGA